jgi:transcriptional regulator with XRE-family HTH domain
MMKGGFRMDQKKIGAFLKDLRREKEITQEQLAEELGVSGRTISRWETGNNMPDISLLVEIAEYFDVSISEIIKGERKSEDMKEEAKEVAENMSDYAKAEKEQLVKSIRNMSIMGHVFRHFFNPYGAGCNRYL